MQRIICALIVLIVSSASMVQAADDNARTELKALEGIWKTVAGEANGKPFPNDAIPDFSFVAAADGMCAGKFSGSEWRFTMTVDPKKNPKTIENVHTSGPQKGMKQYGIYKLEGDKLSVCMSRPGAAEADRPKNFATKDTTNVLFVFERIKEDKKR